jgi:hypothetical protein
MTNVNSDFSESTKIETDRFHFTQYGICFNGFTVAPCYPHHPATDFPGREKNLSEKHPFLDSNDRF